MTYHYTPLKEYLKHLNISSPKTDNLESFKKHKKKLFNTKDDESEEHQKIALKDFLSQSFAYECNTKERVDLSIYEDNIAKVLFEVKSLSNKAEFIYNGGGGIVKSGI